MTESKYWPIAPCPRCRDSTQLFVEPGFYKFNGLDMVISYRISCYRCCNVTGETASCQYDAIEKWNTREGAHWDGELLLDKNEGLNDGT